MIKSLYLMAIIFILFSFYRQSIAAETTDTGYKISITEWITTGEFKMYGGPPNAFNTWELKHPVDSDIVRAVLTYTPPDKNSPYRTHISLGGGSILEGTIRDTDWDANGTIRFLSYSKSKGENLTGSLFVDYRLTEPRESYNIYLGFGYNYLKVSATYRDAVTKIWDYVPTNTATTMKWQIYDLVYQGFEVSLKGDYVVMDDLLLEASAGYNPFVRAQYKGVRYPNTIYRQREHIKAKGDGLSYEAALNYNYNKDWIIQVGYKYQSYYTKGKDQPDSDWAGAWDNLSTNLQGTFLGVVLKF